ncbi:MAG: dockerin type I domain-containing protein, partial [Holophagaceae bacterium]
GSGSNSTSPFYPKMHLGNSIAPDSVYTQTNYVLYKSGNFGSSWTALPMTGYPTNSAIRNFHTSEANQALHVIVGGNGTFYKARIPELNNDAVVDALDLLVVAKHHGSSTATANKWADVNGDGNVGDSDITATIGVLDGAVNNVATWTQLGGTANAALNNSWVWIDTTNEQIMYIGSVTRNLGATGLQSKLYKSTNGGTTWSAIGGASSGLPFGVPVHVIKNIPGDGTKLFCGTDFGIYYSEDSGNTWVRYGAGLPLVAVRDIYIAPDKSFIRIATYGRGVWEINNPTYTASE